MSGRSGLFDPLKVFNFLVEVEGFTRTGFLECNGLEQNHEVIEYREGGDNNSVRKSPGLANISNLTLRRGRLIGPGEDDFIEWAQNVHEVNAKGGSMDFRRAVDIVELQRNGVAEGGRWRAHECWPTRFKPFSDLNAVGNEDSIEELELAVEGLEKVSGLGIGISIATPIGNFGTSIGL